MPNVQYAFGCSWMWKLKMLFWVVFFNDFKTT
jgi:hypothetical protein